MSHHSLNLWRIEMLTSVDTKKLVKLYEKGFSTPQIAEKCGMSQKGVWGRLTKHGVKMRPRHNTKTKSRNVKGACKLTVREIVTLYEGGRPTDKIAERAGVSSTAIRYHLRRAGVTLKKGTRTQIVLSVPNRHITQVFAAIKEYGVKRIL